MMIEREPHPEPQAAWDAVKHFIKDMGRTPEGKELSDNIVEVLMVGAWIGARFSTMIPRLGLAVAEHGNEQKGMVFRTLYHAFDVTYMPFILDQLGAHTHNLGFTELSMAAVEDKAETPDPSTPITDADAKGIMDGLDDWGKHA